jgi:hypothetical protein
MVIGATPMERSLAGIVASIQKELTAEGVPVISTVTVPPGAEPPNGVSAVTVPPKPVGMLGNQFTPVPTVMVGATQFVLRMMSSVCGASLIPTDPLITAADMVPVPAPTMLAERTPAGALSMLSETSEPSQLAKNTASANKALAPNVLTFEIRKKLKFVITPP